MPKCWQTVNAMLSASTSLVFLSFIGTRLSLLTSALCRTECAVSCIIVFKVWLSAISPCTAMRLSSGMKYPFVSPGISSNSTGTGAIFMTACLKSSYPSTENRSSFVSSSGRGLPSVCDTSNTFTARKAGIVLSTSSVCGIPSLPSMTSPVTGSNLSRSSLIMYGTGARILIPCSSFFTWRLNFFRHAWYPAT